MSHQSASQVGSIRDCERKFWFAWLEPREDSGPEAQAGTEIHAVAQAYHDRGTMPDRNTMAGAVFLSGLHLAPRPLVGRAEGEFYATISGIEYKGFVDLECTAEDLPGFDTGVELPAVGIPAVLDYKSKKDFRQAFKGPGDFLNDPQALLYAVRALVKHKADWVALRWVYLKRPDLRPPEGAPEGWAPTIPEPSAKRAKCADALLSRKEVVEAFGRIVHPLAARLVQIKLEKPDPLTLKPTPATCMKYGKNYPCKFIKRCNLTPEDRLGGLLEDAMGDLLEDLEKEFGNAKPVKSEIENEKIRVEAQAPAKGVNPPEAKQAKLMPGDIVKDGSARFPGKTANTVAEHAQDLNHAEIGRSVEVLLRLVRSIWS